MGRLNWHKRNHDKALAGMFELTLEERGAYNTVLDLLYARNGAVPDDDRFLAGWMRTSTRVWRRIRKRLLDLGKLYVEGESLRNQKADEEVEFAQSLAQTRANAGRIAARKRWANYNKNKDLAIGQPMRDPMPIKSQKERLISNGDSASSSSSPPSKHSRSNGRSAHASLIEFQEFWKAYPRKVGKKAADRAFTSAAKTTPPDEILAGLRKQLSALAARDEQYIPHPATWLNQGRWADEPPRRPGTFPDLGPPPKMRWSLQ
jgi:uncharacterized protein YdaU (DUF1376 family)